VTDTHWKVGIEDGKREYCVKWLNYNTHKEDTSQAKSPGLDRIIDDIRRVCGLRIRDFNILFGRETVPGVAGGQNLNHVGRSPPGPNQSFKSL